MIERSSGSQFHRHNSRATYDSPNLIASRLMANQVWRSSFDWSNEHSQHLLGWRNNLFRWAIYYIYVVHVWRAQHNQARIYPTMWYMKYLIIIRLKYYLIFLRAKNVPTTWTHGLSEQFIGRSQCHNYSAIEYFQSMHPRSLDP
jgi:hypothetical protein